MNFNDKDVVVKKLETYHLPLKAPITDGGRLMTPQGELSQILNNCLIRFLAYVEFKIDKKNSIRGNHVHNNGHEILYIINGKLKLHYIDPNNNKENYVILEAGTLVIVPPLWPHAYEALEYTQAIEASDSPYTPERTQRYDFNI